MISKETVAKILKENPDLGDFGFNGGKDPERIINDIEMVEKSIRFLNLCEKNKKTYWTSPGSYSLKHIVEDKYGGYISNGAFIVAAIHCGFPVEKMECDSPNAYIGINRFSIKKALKGVAHCPI